MTVPGQYQSPQDFVRDQREAIAYVYGENLLSKMPPSVEDAERTLKSWVRTYENYRRDLKNAGAKWDDGRVRRTEDHLQFMSGRINELKYTFDNYHTVKAELKAQTNRFAENMNKFEHAVVPLDSHSRKEMSNWCKSQTHQNKMGDKWYAHAMFNLVARCRVTGAVDVVGYESSRRPVYFFRDGSLAILFKLTFG